MYIMNLCTYLSLYIYTYIHTCTRQTIILNVKDTFIFLLTSIKICKYINNRQTYTILIQPVQIPYLLIRIQKKKIVFDIYTSV